MFDTTDDKTTLNTLLATLTDSINGYRDSAENIENGSLKQLFLDSAEERSRVAEDLRADIVQQLLRAAHDVTRALAAVDHE